MFIAGTLGQGGAEKQLFLLARSLKQNGHRIAVVVLISGEYWEDRLVKEGIEVFSNTKKRSRLGKLCWMRNIAQGFKPDVIYSFHFYTSIYSGLLRYLMKGKFLTIGSIRNDGYSEIKANGQWSYWMMHLNHLIIANNKHGREAVLKSFKISHEKIKLMNNAVEIQNLRFTWPKNPPEIKLIFVGRLVSSKNPHLFIEICKKLQERGQNFIADMFGDGELRPLIEEHISSYNLLEKVRIKGNVPEVYKLFNEYDFLLTTSLHEGTPNVVLEAMAMGLPVLSTVNASVIEIFTSVFDVEDVAKCLFLEPDECIVKMQYLFNTPDYTIQLSQRSFEYIRKNHDVRQAGQRWMNIVRNL